MATLTRANVELEVCGIVGRLMTLVGLFGSASACNGANPSLNRPVTDALTRMGYPIIDPTGLTSVDADFVNFAPDSFRRLMEWCELFTLEQVERDWWRASVNPPPGLMARMVGGSYLDPLSSIKSRIVARIAELRRIVMTPYQGMNVQLSIKEITAGSRRDRSIPPAMIDMIAPWRLLPDGLWYYGCFAQAFWGWDCEIGGGWWSD